MSARTSVSSHADAGNLRGPAPTWRPTFGAIPDADGVTFRLWASGARAVALVLEDGREERRVPLQRTATLPVGAAPRGRRPDAVVGAAPRGRRPDAVVGAAPRGRRPDAVVGAAPRGRPDLFEVRVEGLRPGAHYRYLVDDRGPYPDPASRFQPEGVHGPSQVVEWTRYAWTDSAWRGVRFEDLVLYELHVGTFSPPGTFAGVIDQLPHLVELGVSAIELMPVAAFAGRRNWGYDGAALYAPACTYGRPEDLQDLVDRAHGAGLAVLLDVVYNHLGPDGAYLPAFSPGFFSPHHRSPWGDGVNLDGRSSAMVRRFLIENALHWILEYHVDGLRLDATHALMDDSRTHFLEELADTVHALDLDRPVHVIAEDDRNLAALVRRRSAGGMGLDGLWADDFHHEVHRLVTGEHRGYYEDYSGTATDIAATIDRGWFYAGQYSAYAGHARGSEADDVDRQRFVFCLQNHDQVGNRALGERLNQLTDLASCRAAAVLLLLAPETPLLFMGEEWAASTPFLYFTDHHDELGRLVTEGRRREFGKFPAFSDPGARARIPDPQDERTFAASRLNWEEASREPHASMVRLYRALLALRGSDRDLADGRREREIVAHAIDAHTVALHRRTATDHLLVVTRFTAPGTITVGQRLSLAAVLTTEDPPFAPDAMPVGVSRDNSSTTLDFLRPGAIVFRVSTD
jgi:maltooligosyltrehalose trehalohydrolase